MPSQLLLKSLGRAAAHLGGSKGVVPLALLIALGPQALLPSSFFALAASPAASTLSPSRRRVRVLGLCSLRCILPAWRCMSLPVPVNLNRFLAPECVFIFGIYDPFLCVVLPYALGTRGL